MAAAALGTATVAGAAHASVERPIRVLVVGDSVSAALAYEPSLEAAVAKGFSVRFDLRVCRRLASAGCPYAGSVPSSALDAVEAGGPRDDVLVVDVGYNDDPDLYGSGMTELIQAAQKLDVKQIVWVDLKETEPVYRRTNAVIRAVARRFPIVQVADWNAWSAGKPWFRSDGLHLTDAGAGGLALMLRAYIVDASKAAAAATS